MTLYPKNKFPLDDELFQNPTSEYRGTPFWAWNCQMTEDKISMVIDALQEMGMGGGHIHCRTGMNNPYLSEEFMNLVGDAHKKFKEREMITWLYDEDRWPSGAAGGIVTKEHKYRMRFLVFSPKRITGVPEQSVRDASGEAVRSDERTFLGHYQILLQDGWLRDYSRIGEEEEAKEGYDEWFAYLEVSGDNAWFNNQAYVNTLDKVAMDRFIEVTHETYAKYFGDDFGKNIPAIFTDEPQFCHKKKLNYASDKKDIILPYTDDIEETFFAAYGHSLLDSLPELFWEKEGEVSVTRYQYHDHICERFAEAFADNVGDWCNKHNLMLTGHMMEEPTLKSQTSALGEVMRSFRSFQLPGIDMLCDRRELSTAKQAQSAARQFGCPGVMSELYGVTNWDFDFRGHKLQGDWQAALGVTVRVPHLTWTSMAGEAKRDYPASIGYQSPWYKEYKYIEDYFARINTIMTRGKADVKIGVIHPIESYWLYFGTEEKTGGIREEMDDNFKKLIDWLLYNCLDFDFISESLLPTQNCLESIEKNHFPVGEMKYEVIVVPNCVTLRSSTLERLRVFAQKGGKVIFVGDTPRYLDALASEEVQSFVNERTWIPFTSGGLLNALEENRSVEVRNQNGVLTKNIIYQMREEGDKRYLFLAHVNKMKNPDLPEKERLTITIEGKYNVTLYEPLDGTKKQIPVKWEGTKTILVKDVFDHDSLLLVLTPTKEEEVCDGSCKSNHIWNKICLKNEMKYSLSEPNVLVLDQAEYAFDGGEWMPREELLRIDNHFREKIGYQLRMQAFPQPWVNQTEEEIRHTLSLKFHIVSYVDVRDVSLALENKTAKVTWNGEVVPMDVTGWYTDREIVTIKLGDVQTGVNELRVDIPYRHKENIENMFLLGTFGVQVLGSEAVLTELPETLFYGDVVSQGLPFYGGNIEYQIPVEMPKDGMMRIQCTRFRNPLLKVGIDDGEKHVIAFSPYVAEIPCKAGAHVLRLTAFGNRVNTFGTLHNCNEMEPWYGPNAWRTKENAWSYEYQLKRIGVLKMPEVSWKEQPTCE